MSGGSLNYFCHSLEDHVGDFRDKELDALVKDLADLFHDREWFLSGDTSEGSWNQAKKEFKDKWFTETGRKERFDRYIAEATADLRKELQLDERFCKDCKEWKCENDSQNGYSHYGKCRDNAWLTHGYEHACEQFARADDRK